MQTIADIQKYEYEIQFDLAWLNQIELKTALADEFGKTRILALLNKIDDLTRIIPSNPYHQSGQDLLAKIKKLDENFLFDFTHLSQQQFPKLKSYLDKLGLINQIRIELNISTNLCKYFSCQNQTVYTDMTETLGFIGVAVPITNLLMNAYLYFNKWFCDRVSSNKTMELAWYLEQNRLQVLKTSILAFVNLANFIASMMNCLPASLYINFANIGLEFFFSHLQYLKTASQLVNRNSALLETLKADFPDKSIDFSFIQSQLQDTTITPKQRLLMVEILMNEQKLKLAKFNYFFQLAVFASMITNLVVLQTCGLLGPQGCLLAAILSGYFYNTIQPHLAQMGLAIIDRKPLAITDSLENQLVLKHGQLFNAKQKIPASFSPDMVLGLMLKTIMPICIVTLLPALAPPLAIALIISAQLLASSIEAGIKHFRAQKTPAPAIQIPESETPSLAMD